VPIFNVHVNFTLAVLLGSSPAGVILYVIIIVVADVSNREIVTTVGGVTVAGALDSSDIWK
jgi:hypothetical protein